MNAATDEVRQKDKHTTVGESESYSETAISFHWSNDPANQSLPNDVEYHAKEKY